MALANQECTQVQPPECPPGPDPAQGALCGHTAEQYAEAALGLEPRGGAWCKLFATTKAALYRAFGQLLSDFEKSMCSFFVEAMACKSVQLLSEWEVEYGLPGECITSYPTDLEGRQAQVCAARNAVGIRTLAELELLLQNALQCQWLKLQMVVVGNLPVPIPPIAPAPLPQPIIGLCVLNLGPAPPVPTLHNVMGGWGQYVGPSADGSGASVGQPLIIFDPNFVPPENCAIIYHSTMGGWTGGMGIPLTTVDPIKWALLTCLMRKHLPAHILWFACPPQ